MTVKVALHDLPDMIKTISVDPYIMTCSGTSSPRITHVKVSVDDDGSKLHVTLGNSSRKEANQNPHVSILWPAVRGDDLSLIVDGRVLESSEGERGVSIIMSSAILHKRRSG